MAVSGTPSRRQTFRQWLLHRLWYVHPSLDMIITTTPLICIRLLAANSKPDVKRLELRDLFSGGRRYHVYTTPKGFIVLTTSRVPWRYRGRTSPSTVVEGVLTAQDDRSILHLTARIKLTYILGSFLIPLFVSSMVLYTPWLWLIKGVIVLMLFGLSWMARRLNAALEAYETIYFVQQILEPFVPKDSPTLATGNDVVYDSAHFSRVWDSLYHNIKNDS